MLIKQDIKKNWQQVKKQILNKWDKLSAADVDHTHGDKVKLKKLVQDKYGFNENFDSEIEKFFSATSQSHKVHPRTGTKTGEPYKSPNMTDGWKKGSGINVGSQSESEKESIAGENPGTDSTWGYQGTDTNTEQSDVHPGGQINTKDFMQATEPIISDRSYSEAPDEFSPNQDPSLKSEDIPLGGIYSSASNSSAQNAVFNSFEDHSRSTKKL